MISLTPDHFPGPRSFPRPPIISPAPDEDHKDKDILQIDLLQKKDIDAALHLSTQAGWNQTRADWLRLLKLYPESCYLFRKNNSVVGSGTLASYGADLVWIGMILVDPEFRGQGFGKYIFEFTVHEAQARGYNIIGLDATDQGKSLYYQYGFHDVIPVDAWTGRLKATGEPEGIHRLTGDDVSGAIQIDRQWSGTDRSRLIQQLHDEDSVTGIGLKRDNHLRGFAFLRPGRKFPQLGPLVAETRGYFEILLNAGSSLLDNEPVLIDAVRREETSHILEQRGLTIQRQLMRMTWGSSIQVLNDPRLRTATSFELG